ncbi:MAG: APC family permease [Actinobacteria bacterium]|nr:APC family permease [Actinomycetota bacterium]
MAATSDFAKRLLFGRKLRSDRLGETLLPKRIALPVFASDALSSVSYATQEILIVLSLGGLAFFTMSPWIALAVVFVMIVVIASYRQNVRAYPSGGGDYEVVSSNLGPNAGVAVASALFIDYVLTVAVSVAAAVANAGSLFPFIAEHKVLVAILVIVGLTVMNLRGVRESGTLFAVPTYAFIAAIALMVIWAGVRLANGAELQAASAQYDIAAEAEFTGLALVFLVARAFSSGCTALTGVEAISNGVPAFRKPKSANAAATLLMLGVIAITLFLSVTALALVTDVHAVDDPEQLVGAPEDIANQTVIAQVAQAVFGDVGVLTLLVVIAAALILMLAANTAFNGFPVLGSILARDGYLPRQLHTRGDRLAFSNGIIVLALLAILLIYVFDAQVSRLIQLYIVGVFFSFTLSQTGMVRHWTRLLKTPQLSAAERRTMHRNRIINGTGLVITGTVLVIVLLSKFTHGAWIVVVAMPVLYGIMKAIRRHYDTVSDELSAPDDNKVTLPSRVHAIVLVSRVHQPTLRALAYARASRPDQLEALVVDVDHADTRALIDDWNRRDLPVRLRVLDSPFREVTRPILDYVKELRRQSPRDLVTVYVPEYVVGHWWETLLHNQSALRLKTRLRFTPGVMVVSVPWQLRSSEGAAEEPLRNSAGAVRRGEPPSASAEREVAEDIRRQV